MARVISYLSISIAGLMLWGAGCGGEQSIHRSAQKIRALSDSDPCPVGSIGIGVGDGFLEIICGCIGANEPSHSIFLHPARLVCHANPGTTTAVFYYLGTTLAHQVISTGNPSFVSSPVSNPQDLNPLRVYPASLSQNASTYDFQDLYSGLTGQIIVP